MRILLRLTLMGFLYAALNVPSNNVAHAQASSFGKGFLDAWKERRDEDRREKSQQRQFDMIKELCAETYGVKRLVERGTLWQKGSKAQIDGYTNCVQNALSGR